MLRTGLLCILFVALVAQIEAQDEGGNYRLCFDSIRPREMRRAHGRYKRECRVEVEEETGLTEGMQWRKAFNKCVVVKYGWYNDEEEDFDVEAFKTTVNAYMGYSDLSDDQKDAVTAAFDTCIKNKWMWLKNMKCMARECAKV